ncbi:hypothetical protein CBER1_04562 [Cercospora berteroae]|uniref:Uncharacterized protein n=1 Tax=Cercospora berteroae TaxID=357750 RepID=A0A2S6C216_9PEZI|nr:hypothetical protein CBER1_04562 [Cercospora berteroae]
MPKNRRPTTAPPARQPVAQPPRPEAGDNELTTIFADVANALQECGHEANRVLHHWLQLKKQILACDTSYASAWLGRVQNRLRSFGVATREEIEADQAAKEESAQKDIKIRDLEIEVARLLDAAMVAAGKAATEGAAKDELIRKLKEHNGLLQNANTKLERALRVPRQASVRAVHMEDAATADCTERDPPRGEFSRPHGRAATPHVHDNATARTNEHSMNDKKAKPRSWLQIVQELLAQDAQAPCSLERDRRHATAGPTPATGFDNSSSRTLYERFTELYGTRR